MVHIDVVNYPDVTEVDKDDIRKLKDTEYLLKVDECGTGFMAKLNQDGTLPKSFTGWRSYSWSQKELPYLIIDEKYRRGWKFKSMRNGQSASWIVLTHPYGFTVEINKRAFDKIADKLTISNGVILTPCFYNGQNKNAEILIDEDDVLVEKLNEIADELQGVM